MTEQDKPTRTCALRMAIGAPDLGVFRDWPALLGLTDALCAHPELEQPGGICTWALSHVGSGLSVARGLTYDQATQVLLAADVLDWELENGHAKAATVAQMRRLLYTLAPGSSNG